MKRKVLFLAILIFLWPPIMKAQKILTLKECYEYAMAANALAGEKEAYSEISKLKDDNISKGWLPTIDANASFLYNSEVVDLNSALPTPVPGMKPIPNDQYKVTLDINQVIYDGGAIKRSRALEEADLKINEKQTETDLYKLRGQVNTYYFSLLLLERQKELLYSYLEIINKRILTMQSALHNGVILKADIDIMTSEKIKLEQQLTENDIRKNSLMKILSGLLGIEIDNTTRLILPSISGELTADLLRPELELLDLKRSQLDAGLKIIESKRMPKAFGFATLGYGNPPGNNFFRDEFAPYYIVGAGIKWNIFDWNKTSNEKQVITLQQGIVENRKNDMSDNLIRALDAKNAEILSLESLIGSDSTLISIRKRITASSESQYENGIITASDYLSELNSEQQAVINHEIHKINLSLAKIEYLNISGKEIE